MESDERRRNQRIDSHNLISYVCYDEHDEEEGQGMGRTLNVSENGVLLETQCPFEPNHIICLTIALEDELMDIKGKVTFCKQRQDNQYESGIEFIESDEEKLRHLRQFIEIFKGEAD